MSGHSKFANIKHKKEKNDAAKGKIFTIIGREIAVAVKEGGADPANNFKLSKVIAKAKAFKVTTAKGKVTFKKAKGNKKIAVSKAGKVTVKKGLKKGTYKVKVKVTAAGNANYKKATKTVTLKVKVA